MYILPIISSRSIKLIPTVYATKSFINFDNATVFNAAPLKMATNKIIEIAM
jgi:hypothetical protein